MVVVYFFLRPQLPPAMQQGGGQKNVSHTFSAIPSTTTKLTEYRNQNRFPLDAIIAYVLHENPQPVKPYAALDTAVVYLSMTGNFPEEFSRQDVEAWAKSADAESDNSSA